MIEKKYDIFLIDNKLIDGLLSLGMTFSEIEDYIKNLEGNGIEKNQKIEMLLNREDIIKAVLED
jgi:hypothetical protein